MLSKMTKAIGNGFSNAREAIWPRDTTTDEDMAAQDTPGEDRVPVNPRPYLVFGLVVILVTFGIGGGWAALAQLNSAVIATGTVKVFSSRKLVQHLEGGIVKDIMVKNGDEVQEGQVLVVLDQTRAVADSRRVQTQYDQAAATVARLIAERDDAEAIKFPDHLMARRDQESVAETIDGQMKLFEARRQSHEGQLSMVGERMNQLKEEISGLRAQAEAKAEQIRLITEELEGLRELHERGYAPRTRILALERAAAQLRGERGDHVARVAQAKVLISEAELEKLQVTKTYREQVVAELRERQTEMYDLSETLDKVAFQLEHTEIRAPNSGIVVNKQVSAIGQVIRPGETVLELVPQDDSLIIEAQVRPQDVDDVHEGLGASIQLTGLSSRTTPRLEGTVTYVSADSLVDERSGMSFFTANIDVPDEELARIGENQTLMPGMPADVFIQTGARTPLQYLVQPISDSLGRAWREN